MSQLLGFNMPSVPSINITGFLSSTWIYVAIIAVIGLLLVVGVAIFLFLLTYNRKIVLFENLSGQGYQPVLKTRARIIKLGNGGEEILKTLWGGHYVSAYGRKMGKNTYWYAKGQDGYWYNFLLGDLDTKRAMLDIEPIDRDVRMFHVALDRLSTQTYGKVGFLEKYAVHMLLFVFLIALIIGMWFIVGKIGQATAPLAQSNEIGLEVAKTNADVTARLDSIARQLGQKIIDLEENSGIVPAT